MTKEEREEFRREINSRPLTDYISLEKSKGNNMYCCPKCGSGTGKNHTGALSVTEKNGKYMVNCFSGNCFNGAQDTLGALRIVWNCGETEAIERAGYMIENGDLKRPIKTKKENKKVEKVEDFTNFYIAAAESLKNNEEAKAYIAGRGISETTSNHFLLGYCETWKAKTNNSFGKNRIIIPLAKDGYFTRATNKEDNQRISNDGKKKPFNLKGMKTTENPCIFVCEGAFDAMSIYEAGQEAVALCGLTNTYFLEAVKNATNKIYIVALDNDERGKEAAEGLKKKIEEIGAPVICANVQNLYCGYKDANEALTNNKEAFIRAVAEEARRAMQAEPKKSNKPIIYNAAKYINAPYDAEIEELKKYADRKTGYKNIDKYLTLYPGLAALGGQASLGKTTFVINLVLSLLQKGEHVLYFALEQKAEELITKTISQYIFAKDPDTEIDNLQLYKGRRTAEIEEARAELSEKLEHYHIIECDFETTAAEINEIVESYKNATNVKPIVVIDYLQLIAPPADFRGDMRGRVDENLKSLKKMQKNNGLFVLIISSFNRSTNFEPISYESFKETSMIEFTCDYVFGLQLQIQDADNEKFYIRIGKNKGRYKLEDYEKKKLIHEAQIATPKKVQFVAIKNRRGKQYFTANFDYYPAHDYFEETAGSSYNNSYANAIFGAIEEAKARQNK